MERRPVLIVEDDAVIRELLLDALAMEDVPAVAVDNGIDALAAVSRRPPSVMLLDLNLPRLDGEGVLRELQQRNVDVPVLLMTADPRGDRLGEEDGVIGRIPKPFNLDHLFLAIEMVATKPNHDYIG